MKKLGLLVTVKSKNGKEGDVLNFLSSAVALAREENQTLTWYSFQIDASTFGVFDTFETEEGRNAHLTGDIAKALIANAEALLVELPKIEKVTIITSK